MPFRDILLHVDGAAEDRIALGRNLANAYSAHLTGLHVVVFPFDEGHPWAHEVPEHILQSHAAITDAIAEDAQRCFTRIVGPIACTWRRVDGNPGSVMARTARGYDLVVVGNTMRNEDTQVAPTLIERVVLAAGVPVLVVPDGASPKSPGRRIMVAWNGSREAARAVHDAIPLLQRADSVAIREVSSNRRPPAASRRDLEILRSHLEHHGVPIDSAATFSPCNDEGERLHSEGIAWRADLIVMGAYGHARLAEIVLGGVTRHMLKRAAMPLFMAH